MKFLENKIVRWIAVGAVAGLVIFWGVATYQLIQERNGLRVALAAEQNRYKMLHRKYAEEKALSASLQRAKLAAEGALRQAQEALETARAEQERLGTELAQVEEKYAQKTVKLEERVEQYKEQLAKLVENRDQYKAKLAETVAVVKERNAMIYTLTNEKETLTANLQETTSTLNRCEKHNARLSVLSEELVTAYENKGVGASILQKEPLTGLKQVEVEKLIQQYRDRIDNENLELINSHKQN